MRTAAVTLAILQIAIATLALIISQAANQSLGPLPAVLLAVAGGSVVLTLLLARLAVGGEQMLLLEPVRRGTEALRRLSNGETGVRVYEHGLAEVVELSRALNSLAHVLEERERSQRIMAERIQGILDNANVAIHVKDADSRYMLVNREFERAHQLPQHDIVGRTDEELGFAIGDAAAQVRAAGREVIETGAATSFEQEMTTPEGRRTHLSVEFPAHRQGGAITAIAGISVDITDLKEALAQAREASRLKAQFVANMSHELRTPLNGVIGLTDLLRSTRLDPRQSEYVDALARSSGALLTVINDILDFSKIEAGRMTLDSGNFNLRGVVEEACLILAEEARAKGLRIVHELDDRLPVMVNGDRGRLRQILLNLISNGLKFTESGEILVEAAPAGGEVVRFEVSDTGIGLDEETVEHLFEAFVQGDQSITRKFGGTGLGLAISRELASRMGGDIGAAPRVGGGSMFWFTAVLPATASEAPAIATDACREVLGPCAEPQTTNGIEDPGGGQASSVVLIAEDNPINAMVTEALLARQGLKTMIAHDGREAVEMALANEYAAIVMDCQMPHLDGYEATRCIRAKEIDSHVPIIAMTAHSMKGDRERCLAAGMDDYVSKPVQAEELEIVMRRWVLAGEHRDGGHTAEEPSGQVKHLSEDDEILDEILVSQLLKTLGREEREHLLDTFEASLRRCTLEIQGALSHGNRGKLKRATHRLKGSSACLGAKQLVFICQELEDYGDEERAAVVPNVIGRLQATGAVARAALRARLVDTDHSAPVAPIHPITKQPFLLGHHDAA